MRIEIKRRPSSALPVTMADLGFLLIMFLTLTLDPGLGLEVELPVFRYATPIADQTSLTLSIAQDGAIALEGQPVSFEGLASALEAAPQASVVTVGADAAVQYAEVDRVLAVLRAGERYRVVLAVDRPR